MVEGLHHCTSSAQLGSVLGSWGKAMRDAVRNKERRRRRRAPTQYAGTDHLVVVRDVDDAAAGAVAQAGDCLSRMLNTGGP